ncbi:MAG: site-specific DNA-methyltransferase [bacterium]|nr:site-specific DNA-methyltransferase [bacterium]
MAKKKAQNKQVSIEAYSHKGKKRVNNPPVGLVSSQTDKLNGVTKYEHDPYIDPYLSWAGKREGNEVNVRNLSLHIHERVDPLRIIKSFLKEKQNAQMSLFDAFDNKLGLGKAFEFYHHTQDWTNRLIAGDSLLVMNSLLKKEGMAGEVQMVYIDPPYGIKYNSNFQPFVNKRGVKDNNDSDIPAEPEMIKAFRDTWELGVHSYLTYLYDRLLLAKELLNESGSCFVQINEENLVHVREVMGEVFGQENYISTIITTKPSGIAVGIMPAAADFVIWFAKSKEKLKVRSLFDFDENGIYERDFYYYEDADGKEIKYEKNEKYDRHKKYFRLTKLIAAGYTSSCDFPISFNGKNFNPARGHSWRTNKAGIEVLLQKDRIREKGLTIYYKEYLEDFGLVKLNNIWAKISAANEKIYVVQTNTKILERCILMATDPGDLVVDPTCGSGTTAFVAEQWGRRWITCDTSRVAIALAKQRLMTAYFDYYQLAHPNEGLSSGLLYKKVPHVTLSSIANNESLQEETLYDKPVIDKNKIRITGPFTTEAVPGLRVKPFDGSKQKVGTTGKDLARTEETANQATWRDELKTTGIRAIGGKIINFSRIEPMAGTRFLHAEGEILEDGKQKKAIISFGPDYGALEQRHSEEAINEARALSEKPDFLIFAAFHFDPEAAKDIDQADWKGVKILKAQMSVDLLTSDLRKNRSSNQSYWLIGQPDVEVVKNKDGTYKVKVNGFDYYNPVTGEIDAGDTKRIAMWMLDTNYDEQSIMPEQVFFPLKDEKRDWTSLAKTLNGAVNEEVMDNFVGTESLSFKAGEHKKVAVKIIDDRGIESFVIRKL